MTDKISIIVPAYNVASCIEATLDSIWEQTHRELELIVVDDGSTDGTGGLLDACAEKDSRMRVIHQKNGGVTCARLRGVAEATGDWIGFVDGDDFVEPQMYRQLLRNAAAYDGDISHCGYQMVFPDGHIDYYYNTGELLCQSGLEGCRELLSGRRVEPGLCNKLFRRELFDGLSDWMDGNIKINEDLLMNYYLFKHARQVVFEDVCPYHYLLRRGSAATSRLNEHKLCDPVRVLHRIMDDGVASLQPILLCRLTRQLIAVATMALDEQTCWAKPHRKEARKELRRRLGSILSGSACDVKLKIMALWASVWPSGYGWIHRVYAKKTGLDKKYSVD